jgi:hypothetical protein
MEVTLHANLTVEVNKKLYSVHQVGQNYPKLSLNSILNYMVDEGLYHSCFAYVGTKDSNSNRLSRELFQDWKLGDNVHCDGFTRSSEDHLERTAATSDCGKTISSSETQLRKMRSPCLQKNVVDETFSDVSMFVL